MLSTNRIAIILGAMFLSLGAFDGMLGVLWPTLRGEMGRDIGDLGYLLAAYLIASMAGSLLSSWALKHWGIRHGLKGSTVIAVVGAICVALAPTWHWLLAAGVVRGLGNGAIHAYLNTYAARALSNRKTMVIHGMWGGGAAAAAFTMTLLVSSGIAWQWNLLWCVVPALFAFAGYYTLPRVVDTDRGQTLSALKRGDWIAVIAGGTYVAVEASVGNWAYTLMTQGWSMSIEVAGMATSVFWILITVGRISLAGLPLSAAWWLKLMPWMLAGSAGLLFVGQHQLWFGIAALWAVGLSASVIFPSLIYQAITNAQPATKPKIAGAILTCAAAGGASGPAAIGWLASAGALLWIPLPIAALGVVSALCARQVALRGSPASDS
ncbi:MFS transporter [Litorivicinus lipolyticus]|uniref:MFS transporter n=1 Tax=Litorivicinus lipolyticus TaxID=418701 RepID=UPI003B5A18CE